MQRGQDGLDQAAGTACQSRPGLNHGCGLWLGLCLEARAPSRPWEQPSLR